MEELFCRHEKWVPRLGVFLGLLVLLFMIARITGVLQWYQSPTTANAPTLPYDKRFFTSILKKPARYDFICFTTETTELGKHIAVYRLCGLPGDKIEIRKNVLYVNGASPDSNFHLLQAYRMRVADYHEGLAQKGLEPYPAGPDSLNVWLDPAVVAAEGIRATKLAEPHGTATEGIVQHWGKPWSQSGFGPVVVPPGGYFVLGDNRLAANDSRFLGFIKQSAWVGTVLGH